ncbi:MAG: hypothetical protein EAZ55_08545 [Cytophagales bacterium]|nr:MAG: hypothetical protein EAZ55_08545 [Cytophagales bacterium]
MIALNPDYQYPCQCPKCKNNQIQTQKIRLQGIHLLAQCQCKTCHYHFLINLPTGHGLYYPTAIGTDDLQLYPHPLAIKWLAQPLLEAYQNPDNTPIEIEQKVKKQYKEVIFLNCLDFLYGHALLKLLNAQQYLEKHPDKGLILLITPNFEWLIPEGVAEVWILKTPMRKTQKWLTALENFFDQKRTQYQQIYISPAHSHPDFRKIDPSLFFHEKRFDINKFQENNYTITFIWRHDRLWLRHPFWELLLIASQRIKALAWCKNLLIALQDDKIRKTIKKIRKAIPEVQIYITGQGKKTNTFAKIAQDLRTEQIDTPTEKQWAKIYSQSHIVVGIHGSNMIIPTALAGGFVEILPKDRIGNITQDIALPYDYKDMLFLGRFLPMNTTPKQLAFHLSSIWKIFPYYRKNTAENPEVI